MPHILIVDDEETVRDMVSDALRFAGFEVSGAPDAVAALNIVLKTQPDLLVVDINMPGMNWARIAEHLRNTGQPHARHLAHRAAGV